MSSVRTLRLLRRQAWAAAPALVSLFVLVFVTAALAAAVPRQLNATADTTLQQVLADAPEPAREVTASATNDESYQQLDSVDSELSRSMPESLRAVVGDSGSGATTSLHDSLDPETGEPFRSRPYAWLQLRYQTDLLDQVRWVAGRAPLGTDVAETYDGIVVPELEVALHREVASVLGLGVGDEVLLNPLNPPIVGDGRLLVRVSGVFVPRDPTARGWGYDSLVRSPGQESSSDGQLLAEYGSALVTDEQMAVVQETAAVLSYDWHYPIRTDEMDAGNVEPVLDGIDAITARGASAASEPLPLLAAPPSVSVVSGMLEVLQGYTAQRATAGSVTSLVLAGMFVLALLVVGLAAQLVVHRRRGALALTRARGASTTQLVGVVAVEALLVAGLAAGAGLAAAVALVPARSSALSIALVVALVAACVAFLAVGCWRVARHAGRGTREDTVAVRPSRRRTAVEVALVVVAVVGLVLVRRRGVGTADGADPYLATVPVLLAVAAGVLALRMYPYLLRPLLRLFRGSAGAVSFVSLARAARQPPVAALPLAALLLALGFSVFASAVETTVVRGQQSSAWQRVGGDVRLESAAFSDQQVRRMADVAGVSAVVPALVRDDVDLVDEDGQPSEAGLLALDPAAYADLAAQAPAGAAPPLAALPATREDGSLPVLASPGVAAAAGPDGVVTVNLGIFLGLYEARVVGIAESFPTDAGGDFLVADLAALQAAEDAPIRPTAVFVLADAGAGPAVVEAATVGGHRVRAIDRREVLAATGQLPFVDGTVAAFRLGVGAAAVYCLLAVVLALVLTAESRAGLLAALRTLGIDRRQARTLVALELAPMVGVVVVVGLAVGVTLPHLLVPAVDLASFTAGVDPPPPRVDPMIAGLLAAGLVVVVAVAVTVTAVVQRRRRLGDAVRMGAGA